MTCRKERIDQAASMCKQPDLVVLTLVSLKPHLPAMDTTTSATIRSLSRLTVSRSPSEAGLGLPLIRLAGIRSRADIPLMQLQRNGGSLLTIPLIAKPNRAGLRRLGGFAKLSSHDVKPAKVDR